MRQTRTLQKDTYGLHGLGDELADLGVAVGGDGGDLLDLLSGGHGLGHVAERLDDNILCFCGDGDRGQECSVISRGEPQQSRGRDENENCLLDTQTPPRTEPTPGLI